MDDSFASDMMIIVQNQDKRLFDCFENFVQKQINRPFRMQQNIIGIEISPRMSAASAFWFCTGPTGPAGGQPAPPGAGGGGGGPSPLGGGGGGTDP